MKDIFDEYYSFVSSNSPEVQNQIDWKAFKAGKIAIHCDTEEKAKTFVKECFQYGITWYGSPSSETHWHVNKNKTSYSAMYGYLGYSSCKFHKSTGLEVIPYTLSVIHEVKRQAKIGEWVKVVDPKYPERHFGEIAECKSIDSNGDIWSKFKDNKDFCMNLTRYVVLEGYQPSSEE